MKGFRCRKLLVCAIILAMVGPSFSAQVSDNDGSSFITKAEYDSVKNTFQSQIDQYNQSIDSKIDGAIAAYLAGIQVTTSVYPASELNKVKTQNGLGTEYKFGKTWDTFTFKEPNGIWNGYLFVGWGRGDGNTPTTDWCGGIVCGNYISVSNGNLILAPRSGYNTTWDSFNPLTCFETEKITVGDTDYRKLYSKNLYETKYVYSGRTSFYRWAQGFSKAALVGDAWSMTVSNDLYTNLNTTTHLIKWSDCVGNQNITVKDNTRQAFSYSGEKSNEQIWTCEFKNYYKQESTVKHNVGYCVDNINQEMRYVDADQWNMAWWDDGTDTTHTHIGTDGYMNSTENTVFCYLSATAFFNPGGLGSFKVPVFIHKSATMNVDELINEPAMKSRYDNTQPVYFYNGLPLCKCTADGVLTIKLKSKATKADTGDDDASATWTGKLYLSDSTFNKNTTASHVKDENGNNFTGSWTFTNTNKDQTIKITVKNGDEIWLKYNIESITAGDLIEFSTDTNKGLEITASQ